jgi:hypothetical protein
MKMQFECRVAWIIHAQPDKSRVSPTVGSATAPMDLSNEGLNEHFYLFNCNVAWLSSMNFFVEIN